ncbi:MAG: IclR family transcriptional regulator [Nitratireductor sp.]|nr:IclR family transcriptional regulator [Nitratireductor sp.]
MPKISGETTEGIQSVVLALRIMERVAQSQDSIGVTELATALGSTKSRIYRHLQTLAQQGYIIQPDRSERYRVGARMKQLGRQVWQNDNLVRAAIQPMRDLREALGHSCALGQPEHDGVRIVSTLHGKAPFEVGVKPGTLLDFHSTAQGKLALAHMSEEAIDAILNGPLAKSTEETITDISVLKQHLAGIRDQGWATAANQSAAGLNALAVPIFDETGEIAGTLAIVDLVQYLEPKPSMEQLAQLSKAARQISQAVGFAG